MSVPGHTAQSNSTDLETTAELPVLDVADYEARSAREQLSQTDTWAALPAQAPSGSSTFFLAESTIAPWETRS